MSGPLEVGRCVPAGVAGKPPHRPVDLSAAPAEHVIRDLQARVAELEREVARLKETSYAD